MTLSWLLVIIAIWLGIGAVIAAWIYRDTKTRKKAAEWNWIGLGFFLSIIGAIIYLVAVNAEKKRAYEYPPATKYENPDYTMEGGRRKQSPGRPHPHLGKARLRQMTRGKPNRLRDFRDVATAVLQSPSTIGNVRSAAPS